MRRGPRLIQLIHLVSPLSPSRLTASLPGCLCLVSPLSPSHLTVSLPGRLCLASRRLSRPLCLVSPPCLSHPTASLRCLCLVSPGLSLSRLTALSRQATAEANNLSAVAAAKETYTQMMEAVCGGDKPFLSAEHLEAEHLRARDRAADLFQSRRKMGGEEFSERYQESLLRDVQEQYVQYQGHNDSKNVFKAARTPSVLLSVSLVFYILSGVSDLTWPDLTSGVSYLT